MTDIITIPILEKIARVEELRSFAFSQLQWKKGWCLVGFTLNDDQYCESPRGKHKFDKIHTFDPAKKITKITCFCFEKEAL